LFDYNPFVFVFANMQTVDNLWYTVNMIRLKIKPLSLNECYRGRRFKTPLLEAFKEEVCYLLPKKNITFKKIKVIYIFGVSSKNADGDNLIKVFQDALSQKYAFNDKQIYKWDVEKVDVPKGSEFIEFDIMEM